jgi:molybdate transport system regulatory protein
MPSTSARNEFQGVITALQAGPVNCELQLQLPGGTVVHAVITREAVAALGLAVGQPARAVIPPNQVLIAA